MANEAFLLWPEEKEVGATLEQRRSEALKSRSGLSLVCSEVTAPANKVVQFTTGIITPADPDAEERGSFPSS